MKCPNCGAAVKNNFCEYCGTNLNNQKNGDNNKNYQPFNNVGYNYNYNYKYTNDYRQPFAANTGKYTETQQNQTNPPPYSGYPKEEKSECSPLTCLILCLVFGLFGAHRFYTGRIFTGLLYVFTFGLFGIGMAIDLILIVCGAFKDKRKRKLKW